jgi:hypothetical protein
MTPTGTNIRTSLSEIDGQLAEARDDLRDLKAERDRTRDAFARTDHSVNSREFRDAETAATAVADKEGEIANLQQRQVGILRLLGDEAPRRVRSSNGNGPRSGDEPWQNGWQQLASEIDPKGGVYQASVDLGSLMKPPAQAAIGLTPSSGLTAPAYEVEDIQPMGRDVRFLYPLLRRTQVDQGDMAIQEFRQTGTRTVTGSVERDLVSTAAKASLGLSLELVTPPLKQLAIVAEGVPAKLFDAVQGLGDAAPPLGGMISGGLLLDWLTGEQAYQLDKSLDAMWLATIVAAKPAFSETGTTKLQQIRNAISAHRALGANPTILAVSPKKPPRWTASKTRTNGRCSRPESRPLRRRYTA